VESRKDTVQAANMVVVTGWAKRTDSIIKAAGLLQQAGFAKAGGSWLWNLQPMESMPTQ